MNDVVYLIVYGLFSSGVIAGLVSLATKRFIKKHDDKDTLKKDVAQLKKDVSDLRVALARKQLADLIRNYPNEIKIIIDQAEYYFLQLHGNSWAWVLLSKWAEENNVDIEYLRPSNITNNNLKK